MNDLNVIRITTLKKGANTAVLATLSGCMAARAIAVAPPIDIPTVKSGPGRGATSCIRCSAS